MYYMRTTYQSREFPDRLYEVNGKNETADELGMMATFGMNSP